MPLRRKVLLSVSSVVLALLCLEIPALLGLVNYRRWLVPETTLERLPPWDNPRFRFDQDGIIVRQPGLVTGIVAGDLVSPLDLPDREPYHYEAWYDRRGFRNAQDLDRAAVVAVGDSFLEAGKVAQEALLTSRLGDTLGLPVANLGRAAIGPQHELAILKRYGLDLQPQVVLWLFFEGNDLRDALTYQAFAPRSPFEAFRARSFINAVDLGLRGRPSAVQAAEFEQGRRRVCHLPDGAPLWLWYPGGPLDRADLAGLALTEQAVAEAHDLTTTASAQLALIFVPTTWRVYHDRCAFPTDSELARWTLSDLPERLSAFAAQQDIVYLDLTPALRKWAKDEAVFFPDDTHWNAAGNAAAAAVLDGLVRSFGRAAADDAVRGR